MSAVVRLRESLSRQNTPLTGLCREVDLLLAGAPHRGEPQVKVEKHNYRPQRRLSEPELDQLVAEYMSGKTAPQVAELFGIHRQTVARLLASRGVATRSRARIDAKLLAELTWHYERGKSTVELGRQYGLAASSVGKALKKSGVTLRPPKFNRWTTRDEET
ncbi:Hin recombinase [Rhodococcus sp. BP-332]|jgi:transposase|uniref:Hin recombinase n=1 Tax=Rhodococcus sp. BP-332 TaxID=2739447 RepID=UPI001C9BA865|nr:Hin recombinase [Rhodococcus sp. BP-332]MBY6676259.1 Hin recombinase [Rhodococcus sp. BP-332]